MYVLTMFIDVRGKPDDRALTEVRRAFGCLPGGSIVEILATDPDLSTGVAAWASTHGHDLLEETSDGRTYRLVLRHC